MLGSGCSIGRLVSQVKLGQSKKKAELWEGKRGLITLGEDWLYIG
jgi:hypothetical protein